MDKLLRGIDIKIVLQSGSLSLIIALIAHTIWQQTGHQFRRDLWKIASDPIVIALAPYVMVGFLLYQVDPRLVLTMLAAIMVGVYVIKTGHKRFRALHLVILIALAVFAHVVVAPVWGPVVIVGTSVFRELWAHVRGDR